MVGIEVIFISFSQPSVFSYLEKRKKKITKQKQYKEQKIHRCTYCEQRHIFIICDL